MAGTAVLAAAHAHFIQGPCDDVADTKGRGGSRDHIKQCAPAHFRPPKIRVKTMAASFVTPPVFVTPRTFGTNAHPLCRAYRIGRRRGSRAASWPMMRSRGLPVWQRH